MPDPNQPLQPLQPLQPVQPVQPIGPPFQDPWDQFGITTGPIIPIPGGEVEEDPERGILGSIAHAAGPGAIKTAVDVIDPLLLGSLLTSYQFLKPQANLQEEPVQAPRDRWSSDDDAEWDRIGTSFSGVTESEAAKRVSNAVVKELPDDLEQVQSWFAKDKGEIYHTGQGWGGTWNDILQKNFKGNKLIDIGVAPADRRNDPNAWLDEVVEQSRANWEKNFPDTPWTDSAAQKVRSNIKNSILAKKFLVAGEGWSRSYHPGFWQMPIEHLESLVMEMHDQAKKTGTLERSPTGKISQKLQRGIESIVEAGEYHADVSFDMYRKQSDPERKHRRELIRSMESMRRGVDPATSDNMAFRGLLGAVEMVPAMAAGGAVGKLVGGSIAAAAGSRFGQVTGLTELLESYAARYIPGGLAPGAAEALGAKAGFFAGGTLFWGNIESVDIGEGIRANGGSDELANTMAAAGGLLIGATEYVQWMLLAGLYKGGKEAMNPAKDAVRKTFTNFAKGLTGIYAAEVTTEMVQAVTALGARAAAVHIGHLQGLKWPEEFEALFEELQEVSLAMLFIMGPGAVSRYQRHNVINRKLTEIELEGKRKAQEIQEVLARVNQARLDAEQAKRESSERGAVEETERVIQEEEVRAREDEDMQLAIAADEQTRLLGMGYGMAAENAAAEKEVKTLEWDEKKAELEREEQHQSMLEGERQGRESEARAADKEVEIAAGLVAEQVITGMQENPDFYDAVNIFMEGEPSRTAAQAVVIPENLREQLGDTLLDSLRSRESRQHFINEFNRQRRMSEDRISPSLADVQDGDFIHFENAEGELEVGEVIHRGPGRAWVIRTAANPGGEIIFHRNVRMRRGRSGEAVEIPEVTRPTEVEVEAPQPEVVEPPPQAEVVEPLPRPEAVEPSPPAEAKESVQLERVREGLRKVGDAQKRVKEAKPEEEVAARKALEAVEEAAAAEFSEENLKEFKKLSIWDKLEISSDATLDEIAIAANKKSLMFHPDRVSFAFKEAGEWFKEITNAKKTIGIIKEFEAAVELLNSELPGQGNVTFTLEVTELVKAIPNDQVNALLGHLGIKGFNNKRRDVKDGRIIGEMMILRMAAQRAADVMPGEVREEVAEPTEAAPTAEQLQKRGVPISEAKRIAFVPKAEVEAAEKKPVAEDVRANRRAELREKRKAELREKHGEDIRFEDAKELVGREFHDGMVGVRVIGIDNKEGLDSNSLGVKEIIGEVIDPHEEIAVSADGKILTQTSVIVHTVRKTAADLQQDIAKKKQEIALLEKHGQTEKVAKAQSELAELESFLAEVSPAKPKKRGDRGEAAERAPPVEAVPEPTPAAEGVAGTVRITPLVANFLLGQVASGNLKGKLSQAKKRGRDIEFTQEELRSLSGMLEDELEHGADSATRRASEKALNGVTDALEMIPATRAEVDAKEMSLPDWLDKWEGKFRAGVMTKEGKFILGLDHGDALARAEDAGFDVGEADELGQAAGWKIGDEVVLDKDVAGQQYPHGADGVYEYLRSRPTKAAPAAVTPAAAAVSMETVSAEEQVEKNAERRKVRRQFALKGGRAVKNAEALRERAKDPQELERMIREGIELLEDDNPGITKELDDGLFDPENNRIISSDGTIAVVFENDGNINGNFAVETYAHNETSSQGLSPMAMFRTHAANMSEADYNDRVLAGRRDELPSHREVVEWFVRNDMSDKVSQAARESHPDLSYAPPKYAGIPNEVFSLEAVAGEVKTGVTWGAQKVKEFYTKYFTWPGRLGRTAKFAQDEEKQRVASELNEARNLYDDLKRAIKQEYGVAIDSKKMDQGVKEQLREALSDPVVRAGLPARVGEALAAMRDHIKALSHRLIDSGRLTEDMELIFDDNMEAYLHRAFQGVEDPGWATEVRENRPELVEAAKESIQRMAHQGQRDSRIDQVQRDIKRQGRNGRDATVNAIDANLLTDEEIASIKEAQKWKPTEEQRKNMTRRQIKDERASRVDAAVAKVMANIKSQVEEIIADNQTDLSDDILEGRVEALLYRLQGMANYPGTNQGSARANEGILKRRKEIDDAILELYGEYTDVGLVYARSIHKMANLLAKDQFQKDLVAIMPEDMISNQADRVETPVGPLKGSEWGAMEGLYVSPHLVTAIKDSFGSGTEFGWMARHYFKAVSGAKAAKTIYSVVTTIRNLVSNGTFAFIHGHFRINNWRTAFKYGWYHMAPDVAPGMYNRQKPDHQVIRDFVNKMVDKGVLENSLAKEMTSVIEEAWAMDFNEYTLVDGASRENLARRIQRKIGRRGRKIHAGAAAIYQAMDEIPKMVGFMGNVQLLNEAYPEMSQEEIEDQAAERVKNQYPTWSRVSSAVQSLRRWPFHSTFPTFVSELYRTTYHTFRQAKEDIQSGNPRLRKHGYATLVRFAGASYVAKAIIGLISTTGMGLWTGVDDEEREALDRHQPPWSRYSTNVYWKDKDGNARSIDMSHNLPHMMLLDPLNALFESDVSMWDRFINAAAVVAEPVTSEEIVASKLIDLARGRKKGGGEIFNPEDTDGEKAWAMVKHLWQPWEPGTVSTIKRIGKGWFNYEEKSGRVYSTPLELLAGLGLRVHVLDPKISLRYMSMKFTRRLRDANRRVSSVAYSGQTGSSWQLKGRLETTDKARQHIYHEMHKDLKAAYVMGMSEGDAYRIMIANNISDANARLILRDSYAPQRFQKSQLRDIYNSNEGEKKLDVIRKWQQKSRE